MSSFSIWRRSLLLLGMLLLFSRLSASASDQPQWVRISSAHFSVLTDAGDKRGRETALRFEQMRAVFGQLLLRDKLNLSEPLDIVAVKSDEEYARLAPVRQGQLTSASGFFLPGEDRNYIVLDLADDQSWRAASHDFAHLLLNYNYPPTQGWFDEGFAEYFSSLQVIGKQVQLGGDPELYTPQQSLIGNTQPVRNPPKSLSDLLSQPVWLSFADLFATRHNVGSYQEGSHHTMFYAEAWIVVHYLINKNKLSETGNYFQLVENEKIPVEQAVEKAYGMTLAQFEQAVKEYYKSIAVQSQNTPQVSGQGNAAVLVQQFPAPVQAGDMGATTRQIPIAEARALVAEVQVRLPEHRDAGIKELEAVIGDPKLENAIAHRALGWVAMEKKDPDTASEELKKAIEIDGDDPWPRYYLSALRFRNAQFNGQYFLGMANMMQDLRAVIEWDPEFANAYSMLAMARLEGGGTNSAMEAMRSAIRLNPRSENYLLNMARIYLAGKKWAAASALLKQLASSSDAQIARSARKSLEDMPALQKYGILPVESENLQKPVEASASVSSAAEPAPKQEDEDEARRNQQPAPVPDKRPVKYLKGKLQSVDCSVAPAAVITVTEGKRTMKLRAEDYKALVVIGADQFSCGWKNLAVVVNYKSGGRADGDLVSLELQ